MLILGTLLQSFEDSLLVVSGTVGVVFNGLEISSISSITISSVSTTAANVTDEEEEPLSIVVVFVVSADERRRKICAARWCTYFLA